MKQVILLPDGSKVEIDGNNVKHVDKDGKVLYDYSASKPYVGWGEEFEYDDYDDDWN